MASILPDLQEKKQLHSRVSRFFRQAKIGSFLNQSHILKVKGFSPFFLIQFFFHSCSKEKR
ncbi:hypothetical protein [Sporolactobacillus pectinivorans]|uniref:hypothetical protein n=1 Tax=Sporolactobacillus pectinivorans TaxID=1591408 RepID=UPI001EFD7E38|nr:hypothetical protein [Sporolactobacillus pectinivorans]